MSQGRQICLYPWLNPFGYGEKQGKRDNLSLGGETKIY
jgi:hypothetical protein